MLLLAPVYLVFHSSVHLQMSNVVLMFKVPCAPWDLPQFMFFAATSVFVLLKKSFVFTQAPSVNDCSDSEAGFSEGQIRWPFTS